MAGKRVLITGVSGLLGASVAKALEESGDIEFLLGVGIDEPPIPLERTEFARADIRSPLIHKILTTSRIDTVVHADLTSSVRVGGRSAQKERNVIGTMQLFGACQRAEKVNKVIVRSSTAVYGSDATHPSILTEAWSAAGQLEGYSKDIADAETFARDFGRRRPDVTLTVLRMANVVGPRAETNMTQLFSLPFIPTAFGFDPRLQLLHEEDAFEVIRKSVAEDHAGVFNVAADGVIYLSQAIRIAKRLPIPILGPLGVIAGDVLRRVGLVDFPSDQLSLVIHGRVVDTGRMKTNLGFEPKYSTMEAFRDFIDSRGDDAVGPKAVTDWERRLYDRALDFSRQWFGDPARRPYVVSNVENRS